MTRKKISALLDALPDESLAAAEQFLRLLRQQARHDQPVVISSVREGPPLYLYPTVAVPASSLNGWLNLLPEGYEGDAFADSETLYDEIRC
ncbi:MAG: hypothetical protein KKD28_12795 [Chloroflexi bacterium]|nr:hypothetical protein [Chloroflexota bacterium]MBU1662337.1 hypothetical protein [Chloroflexota bacterium]